MQSLSHCVEILKKEETVSDLVAIQVQNTKRLSFPGQHFTFFINAFFEPFLIPAELAVSSRKLLGSCISIWEGQETWSCSHPFCSCSLGFDFRGVKLSVLVTSCYLAKKDFLGTMPSKDEEEIASFLSSFLLIKLILSNTVGSFSSFRAWIVSVLCTEAAFHKIL